MPEFVWPAAFVLGAIAAPRRMVTNLEGEGLVNDATALVAEPFDAP